MHQEKQLCAAFLLFTSSQSNNIYTIVARAIPEQFTTTTVLTVHLEGVVLLAFKCESIMTARPRHYHLARHCGLAQGTLGCSHRQHPIVNACRIMHVLLKSLPRPEERD
eukprot:5406553-Pyramimonas_sp.AAC.2